MNKFIERPFELRCPNCKEWTNIHCTDEELFPKSLNGFCPHCSKVLNYYALSNQSDDGNVVMILAHTIEYRRTIIL